MGRGTRPRWFIAVIRRFNSIYRTCLAADLCSRLLDASIMLSLHLDNSHPQVRYLALTVIWFDLNDSANCFTAT